MEDATKASIIVVLVAAMTVAVIVFCIIMANDTAPKTYEVDQQAIISVIETKVQYPGLTTVILADRAGNRYLYINDSGIVLMPPAKE